jgi:hypothetical protein
MTDPTIIGATEAAVETFPASAGKDAASWTHVKFAGTPTQEQIDSVLQISNGDHTVSGREITLYWRNPVTSFKTVMVGKALKRGHVTPVKLNHYGTDIIEEFYASWDACPWPNQ